MTTSFPNVFRINCLWIVDGGYSKYVDETTSFFCVVLWNRIETLVPLGDLANLDRVRRSHHPEPPLFFCYSRGFDERLFENLATTVRAFGGPFENVIRDAWI